MCSSINNSCEYECANTFKDSNKLCIVVCATVFKALLCPLLLQRGSLRCFFSLKFYVVNKSRRGDGRFSLCKNLNRPLSSPLQKIPRTYMRGPFRSPSSKSLLCPYFVRAAYRIPFRTIDLVWVISSKVLNTPSVPIPEYL